MFPFQIDELLIYPKMIVSPELKKITVEPFVNSASTPKQIPSLPSALHSQKITVDGIANEKIWQQRPRLSGFITMASGDKFHPLQTSVYSSYDQENLYLFIRCNEPSIARIKSTKQPHDSNIFNEDSVEIILAPREAKLANIYQFIINASGSVYDKKGRDKTWNGNWGAATQQNADNWTLEVQIPWKTLGIDKITPDEKLYFNICRNRFVTSTPEFSCTTATQTPSYFYMQGFGSFDFRSQNNEEENLNRHFIDHSKKSSAKLLQTIENILYTAKNLWGENDQYLALAAKLKSLPPQNSNKIDDVITLHEALPYLHREVTNYINREHAAQIALQLKSNSRENHTIAGHYVISKANGMLLCITDQQKNPLTQKICDRYTFETATDKKNVWNEWFDKRIAGSEKITPNSYEATYQNSEFPQITVHKKYSVIDNNALHKEVTFSSNDSECYQISGITDLILQNDFKKSGTYFSYPSSLTPNDLYLVPASSVRQGEKIAQRIWQNTQGKALIAFSNRTSTLGLGQFQHTLNKQNILLPMGFDMTMVTDQGWELSWFCGSLGKTQKTTSASCVYTLFDGDRTAFHLKRKKISQFDESWQDWTPLKRTANIRLVCDLPWYQKWPQWEKTYTVYETRLNNLHKKFMRPTDEAIGLTWMTVRWGQPPVNEDSVISFNFNLTENAPIKKYAEVFHKIPSRMPFMNTGIYYWPWGPLAGITNIEKDKKEWFVHDKKGNVKLVASPFAANIGFSNDAIPLFDAPYAAWWLGSLMQMVDYLKLKMVYTDGAFVATSEVDWRTMRMRTPKDGEKMAKKLWQECRKRNVLYFAHDNYVMLPYKDVHWMESIESLSAKNWRSTGELLLHAKLYANPEVPQFMIYWRKENLDTMAAQGALLGLRPSTLGYADAWQNAYAQLTHEMFRFGIVTKALQPCYWLQATELEAYFLKRNHANLITLRNNSAQGGSQILTLNYAVSHLVPGQKTWAFYNDLASREEFGKTQNLNALCRITQLPESSIEHGQYGIKIKLPQVLPGTVKHLSLTQIPAVVWSIDNVDTMIKAPEVLNTVITYDSNQKILTVNSDLPAEILLLGNVAPKDIPQYQSRQTSFGMCLKVAAGKSNIPLM